VKGSMTEDVDVVVVGTAAAARVMAKELAKAGKSVLMIERGGFYLIERGDFDQREDDMFARIDGGRGSTPREPAAGAHLRQATSAARRCTTGRHLADSERPAREVGARVRKSPATPKTSCGRTSRSDREGPQTSTRPEDARLNTMNRLFEVGREGGRHRGRGG